MRWRAILWAVLLVAFGAICSHAYASDDFSDWRDAFSKKALAAGIPAPVIDENITPLTPDEDVIERDQQQPEDKLSYTQYLKGALNAKRVAIGRKLMEEHGTLLKKISKEYEVEPRFIVALWGIETDYGSHAGNYDVVQSLATLAYDGRRRDFFENELIDALQIIAKGPWKSDDLVGSWAGAMGNCQFMPSSYLQFAVDWDKDGKADIWNSVPDSLASIANYLHQSGWKEGIGWGKAAHDDDAIYPGEKDEGGFDVTSNFDVIMKWNRSRYFATSVGLLADALGGK